MQAAWDNGITEGGGGCDYVLSLMEELMSVWSHEILRFPQRIPFAGELLYARMMLQNCFLTKSGAVKRWWRSKDCSGGEDRTTKRFWQPSDK